MVMINDDIRCNINNYQKGRIGKIKYIVVHYTASPNDTAEGEATLTVIQLGTAEQMFIITVNAEMITVLVSNYAVKRKIL